MRDELMESARRELLRHLDALLDGRCDESGQNRIAELLVEFPSLKRTYVLYSGQAAGLHSISSEIEEGAVIAKPRDRSPAPLFNLGACAAVLGLTTYIYLRPAPPIEPVGVLVGSSSGAVWAEDPELGLASGTPLLPSLHQLEKGFVEIKLLGGATAVLEAPVAFRLIDEDTVELVHGKIASTVGSDAVGFTVNLPQGPVVDLGTRFGVELSNHAPAEVHVLDGATEFLPKSADEENVFRVVEGGALAIPADPQAEILRMAADPDKFIYSLADIPLGLKLPYSDDFSADTMPLGGFEDGALYVSYLGSEVRSIVGRLAVSVPADSQGDEQSAGILLNRDLRLTAGSEWRIGMDLGIGREGAEKLDWLGFEVRGDTHVRRANSYPASDGVGLILTEDDSSLTFNIFVNGQKVSSHNHSLTPTHPRDPIAALGVALVFNETSPTEGARGVAGLSLEIEGETVIEGLQVSLPNGGRYLHLVGDGSPTSFHVFDKVQVTTF